jgi:hypothetical protein
MVNLLPGQGAPAIGDTVAIDYHGVTPFYPTMDYAPAFACLTEPGVHDFNVRVARALSSIFPADSGFFMGYDELRIIDNCNGCKAAGTPGQVLAANIQSMTDALVGANGVRPGARAYVWSDMFDKFHNAHDDYYFVDGDLAGSWKGVEAGVILFNWHPVGDVLQTSPSDLNASLKFFAGVTPDQPVPHRQIISGYYDPAINDPMRGCLAAQAEMAKAMGVPGILGMMYTTWADDYSQLENYANCARQAWDAYRKSVP